MTDQNAAGYQASLAPEMIAFAQAPNVAPALAVAPSDWPTQLGGVSINVTDSKGQRRAAPIYYVAPTSAGYLIPTGTALGAAQVTLTHFQWRSLLDNSHDQFHFAWPVQRRCHGIGRARRDLDQGFGERRANLRLSLQSQESVTCADRPRDWRRIRYSCHFTERDSEATPGKRRPLSEA